MLWVVPPLYIHFGLCAFVGCRPVCMLHLLHYPLDEFHINSFKKTNFLRHRILFRTQIIYTYLNRSTNMYVFNEQTTDTAINDGVTP